MLILKRKDRECIRIGDDIKVLILEVHCSYVTIGIAAPDGVKIYREEVYSRIRKEKTS